MFLEEFTRHAVIAPITIVVIYLFYLAVIKKQVVPENLPWIGRKPGIFANLRANIAGSINNLAMFDEGYNKYSKNGKYFVMPSLTTGPMVVLPQPQIKWLMSQPSNILDADGPQRELLSSDHTMDVPILESRDHIHALVRDLTRNLGSLTADIAEELDDAFKRTWGEDTEKWTEISPYETIMEIVAQTANRVFVGLPLCRDPIFNARCERMAQSVAGIGVFLRAVPDRLRPLLAVGLTLPIHWYTRKCKQSLYPVVRQRLDERERNLKDPGFDHYNEPNDLTQWLINISASRNDKNDLTEDRISTRILADVFAAIHTSTMTGTSTLYDLAASPPSKQYLETLRLECQNILASDNNTWTKDGLAKMYGIDSTIRESQRMNGLSTGGLTRRVVARNGVYLPDGTHAPCGTTLTVGVWSIAHDGDLYDDPGVFNPLRFSKMREELMQREDLSAAETLKQKNMSMVAVSDRHLAFGLGKHACPGRFFAANELKLFFAYAILNYDIQHLPTRPANNWFADFSAPPMGGKISVRRRKKEVR